MVCRFGKLLEGRGLVTTGNRERKAGIGVEQSHAAVTPSRYPPRVTGRSTILMFRWRRVSAGQPVRARVINPQAIQAAAIRARNSVPSILVTAYSFFSRWERPLPG